MYDEYGEVMIYSDGYGFFEEREGPRLIQQKRVELPFQARGWQFCMYGVRVQR